MDEDCPAHARPAVGLAESATTAWRVALSGCAHVARRTDEWLGRRGLLRLRERLLSCRFELVARVPLRHLIRLRDEPAGIEADRRVLDHAVEHPFARDLVTRLVVDVLGPLFFLRAAP